MNYLFEAIESEKLSKTMGFVDEESRVKFLESLKKISKKFDFPLSKFKDDYFQYLPFYKALALNSELVEQVCEAKSSDCFPRHGIEGEVCQSGKIKRTWGSGVRSLDCPSCDGTGIVKSKGGLSVKWMKFWFSKDGKFETITISDGSSNISKDINTKDVKSIPHLTPVSMRMKQDGWSTNRVEGIIYRDQNGSTYFIHNNGYYNGGSPIDAGWTKYGSYSWSLGGDDFKDILVIGYIESDGISEYSFNFLVDDRLNKKNGDVKKALANSAFSIVLDYSEFQNKLGDVEKLSTIIGNRKEQKKDALKLKSDKDIKTENIKRYINNLKVNIDIENLSNIKRLLMRILGWKMVGVYVMRGRGMANLEEITQRLFYILSGKDVEHNIECIENKIQSCTNSNLTFNNKVLENLKKMEMFSENGKMVVDGFNKLNDYLYNYINSLNIETIEDIDNLYFNLKKIRAIVDSSWRYYELNDVYARIANALEDDFESHIKFSLLRREESIPVATEQINKVIGYL